MNEKLKERQNESKYRNYTDDLLYVSRYQHIERLGSNEIQGLLQGKVFVQTKIDGANLSVWTDPENGLTVASRNLIVFKKGARVNSFNGAINYILNHPGIIEVSKKYILRGEWLTPHTIVYNKDAYKKFYIFDVQEYTTEKYLTPDEYIPILKDAGIEWIASRTYDSPKLSELMEIVEGEDIYGAKQKEGIVIKNFNFVNNYGRVVWGKIVHSEFKESNKLKFGATKKDPQEIRFISRYITEDFVLKTIHKIKEEVETLEIKQMPRILQTVWYDVFREELWDFVKKEKVESFDFKLAYHLCIKATRDVALAYFNGLTKEGVKNVES